MCSLQEHIERDIRARKAEQDARTGNGPFSLPSARRWTYQGTEKHYGYTYHLWQNARTGRKHAWEVGEYRHATTNTKEPK